MGQEPLELSWLMQLPGFVYHREDPVVFGYIPFGNNGNIEFFVNGVVQINGAYVGVRTRGGLKRLLEALKGDQ